MKGIEIFTLDVEEGVEPVIPEAEGCEETDGRDPWERKWQTDLEEDPCFTGSIYPSRLKNGSGIVRLKKVRIKMMLKGLNNIGMMRAPTVSPK